MSGKIQYMRQSAGNFFNEKEGPFHIGGRSLLEEEGSSETTCEKCYNNNFLYRFIGLVEGDGSFIINKNGSLEFKVTQSSVDVQVLYYIKKALGFGTVRVQDKYNNT